MGGEQEVPQQTEHDEEQRRLADLVLSLLPEVEGVTLKELQDRLRFHVAFNRRASFVLCRNGISVFPWRYVLNPHVPFGGTPPGAAREEASEAKG